MAQLRVMGLLSCCVLGLTSPVSAQYSDRIWGHVLTASGDEYEGFLRWGRNEGSWVDVLDGTKDIPEENYLAWLEANDEERAVRVIELRGHRVSWEEEHPDFALTKASGIRFGHMASLEVIAPDRVELVLRSGETVELEDGGNDLGSGLGRLVVHAPGEEELRLRWAEIERVEFSAAPRGARAKSQRLHGTVEDGLGRRFTGYIAWDVDEILGADVLDGEEVDGGAEHEIPFDEIASIERTLRGSRVVLTSGEALELTDSNDVDDGNRGIQISDPVLGLVEIEWEAFRILRFHEADEPVTYDAFDGGRLLRGTVVTQDGEELEGMIRWDADEAASWEFLDGRRDDVVFKIEMSYVRRIERGEAFGALVTLVDGRSFELDDSNDVDWDNKGIMVAPESADASEVSAWRLVPWDEFREIRFR